MMRGSAAGLLLPAGVDAGALAMTASPTAITPRPALTIEREPIRSATRALNGVNTAPMTIIGRNTQPVSNADRPRSSWR